MEKHWLQYLATLQLSCFADRQGLRYSVHDARGRKTYLTNFKTAHSLFVCKTVDASPRIDQPSDDAMKTAYGFLRNIREINKRELKTKKPFNPLFARWEILDLGRYDNQLSSLSNLLAPIILPLGFLLLFGSLAIGILTEWQIFRKTDSIISFSGIAMFAALSPLLKIPHELGHALTARRFNVNLSSSGVIFVGLFPLPFVDCSNADLQANRVQRIKISLAGVFVDLLIAMIAFILWHFSSGELLRTLYFNVFLFSSLNSLLFNGNPLIKLDGYYAFVDILGHRNLGTIATQKYKEFKRFFASFGRQGALPVARAGWLYIVYAVGSSFYKVVILLSIIWLVIPKFFGLGLLLVVWGAYVMFLSPLLRQPDEELSKHTMAKNPLRKWFWSLVIIIAAGLAFVPFPYIVTIPMSLDFANQYNVSVTEAGRLAKSLSSKRLESGEPVAFLGNLVREQEADILEKRLELLQQTLAAVSGVNPTDTQIVIEQIVTLQQERKQLLRRQQSLTVVASTSGLFIDSRQHQVGSYLTEGSVLGYLLPFDEHIQLIGRYPERRVHLLQQSKPKFELWYSGRILTNNEIGQFNIIQETELDPETGSRTYSLSLKVKISPQELIKSDIWLRINLGTVPIYAHVRDLLVDLRQQYRDSQTRQLF